MDELPQMGRGQGHMTKSLNFWTVRGFPNLVTAERIKHEIH